MSEAIKPCLCLSVCTIVCVLCFGLNVTKRIRVVIMRVCVCVCAQAEEELGRAQKIFEELNVELQDELPVLWDR